jgi:hypothetical protein
MLASSDRTFALVQPSDLARSLAEWHGAAPELLAGGLSLMPIIRGDGVETRQCVGIVGQDAERALVTPAWYLRHGKRPELFLRPDDRWCANDVADRCPEIVEALSNVLAHYRHAMHTNEISFLPRLEPELLVGPE